MSSCVEPSKAARQGSNRLLVLAICALPLIAAEKSRNWQTGQVLDSRVEQTTKAWGGIVNQKTALVDREVHTIESADRDFLVTGSIGSGKQALTVGMAVRFAVEGKTMFISLAGREYRLQVLEERVAAARVPELPRPTEGTVGDKPSADASEPLDNDAVVKMIVGGLKEETVTRVIEARPGKFTLTPDAMIALKAAGVPQNIIAAMSAKMAARR